MAKLLERLTILGTAMGTKVVMAPVDLIYPGMVKILEGTRV